ncbi:MAG: hypothetical protein DLM58_03440 [Pseudonocardiales bacterium]|nr:MAG: hypothetical protein DLM58_03440 [Pseudonocardiales bacterium]
MVALVLAFVPAFVLVAVVAVITFPLGLARGAGAVALSLLVRARDRRGCRRQAAAEAHSQSHESNIDCPHRALGRLPQHR